MKSLGQPELLDLLVQPASGDVPMDDAEDMRPSKKKVIYIEVTLSTEAVLFCVHILFLMTSCCSKYCF